MAVEMSEVITEQPPVRERGRGFAAMTREEHLALASKGGKASQATGKGHRFTSETARVAGRKGGGVPRVKGYTREQLV